MDRTRTILWTRASQAAAAAGLTGAVLAGVFVGHTPAPIPPPDLALPTFTPLDSGEGVQASHTLRPDAVASRLSHISNKPAAAAPPPTPDAPPPPPPPPPAASVTYHGMVAAGSSPLALIRADGKQAFVKVGDIVQGRRVRAIESGLVRLSATDDPAADTLDVPLSERTGGPVTLATQARPQPPRVITPAAADRMGMEQQRTLDFKMMADGQFESFVAPLSLNPEDYPLYQFMRSRLARDNESTYSEAELDKLAGQMVEQNRDEYYKRAIEQIGEDRYNELIKLESQRQDELQQKIRASGGKR